MTDSLHHGNSVSTPGSPPPFQGWPQEPPSQRLGWAPPAPMKTEPLATWSLVVGLVGLVVFGIVLGVAALAMSIVARRRIAESANTLKGSGLATAGLVLGILDIGAFFLILGAVSSGS
jgi:hypothetical protein